MSRMSTGLLIISLMIGAVACKPPSGKAVKIETDVDKASYAIGTQIGRNIKMQSAEIDVDVLAVGIRDMLEGKEMRMTDEEVRQAMINMQMAANKKRDAENEVNLKTGMAYLEKNKTAEGVKVTDSGLQYKVVTAGSGDVPKADSKVKVHYRGTLTDGTEFDSSYKRNQPAEFPVNGVIKGWTEALQMMKVGAKWQLAIPADLAYGKRARPNIPANSVLLFDVELLEILK